jgi:hypothetical protein
LGIKPRSHPVKIKIRYPFSLRGIPEGKRSEKYIHASYDFPFDVPVVDQAETQIVLTSHRAYADAEWHDQFNSATCGTERPIAHKRHKPFEVTVYHGRMYTYCCPLFELETRLLCGPRKAGDYDYIYSTDTISTTGRPTETNPLLSLYEKYTDIHPYMLRDAKRAGFQWVTWINDTFPPFDTWRDTLLEYRLEDVVDAEATYSALSKKLIIIGDNAWIECGTPCIVVSKVDAPAQAQGRFVIHHDFISCRPRHNMIDQEFSLDQGEAALNYAARYADGNEVVDLRLTLEVTEDHCITFDHEQNRFWRQAQMLAIHCATCTASGGRGKLATSEHEKEVIAKALAEAVKFTAVTGTVGEPEAYLPELTDLAQRFDRKWFPGFAWGGKDKPIRKRFLDETVEMFLNRPIHLFKLSN